MIEKLAPSLRLKTPKEKPFYHKANALQRVSLEILSRVYITRRIHVEGVENMQSAQDLWRENKRLAIFPNHLSNADAELIYQVFKKQGFRDLAKMLIFAEGEKLRRNPFTKFLTGSQSRIFVWPDSLEPQNEEEENQKTTMNVKATFDFIKAVDNSYIVVVFPQGGRSYEGPLTSASQKVARFLKLIGIEVILPIGISGIEKIFPPGKKLVLPKPFQIISFNVGRPIDLNSVFEQYKEYQEKEQYSKAIDHLMRNGIVPLLEPEYHGVYGEKYAKT